VDANKEVIQDGRGRDLWDIRYNKYITVQDRTLGDA
jgi:hypothetical protein